MKNTISAFILLGVLVGCASAPPSGFKYYSGKSEVVNIPEIGKSAEAELGQTIISKINASTYPAVELSNDYSSPISGVPANININAGVHKLSMTDDNGSYYNDINAKFGMIGALTSTVGGIYVPNDSSKPPVAYQYASGSGEYRRASGPAPQIKRITTTQWGKDSFKRELIYTGVSQNTVTISYREFMDSTARPAFSQDLRYDLSQGRTIGYKGARFEVLDATNTSIRYRVVKPLD